MTYRTPEQLTVVDSLAQNRRYTVRSARQKLGFTIGAEPVRPNPIDQQLNLGKFDPLAHQPTINVADSLEKANKVAFDKVTIESQRVVPADVAGETKYA